MLQLHPAVKQWVDPETGEVIHDALELRIRARSIQLLQHTSVNSSVIHPRAERGEIFYFSKKSRFNLSDLVINTRNDWKYFFTLTYHENFLDGKKSKFHLNRFFTGLRKEKIIDKYVWVLEFQKRGSIHYHFFINDYFTTRHIADTNICIRSNIVDCGDSSNVPERFRTRKKRGFLETEQEIKFFKRVTYLWLLASEQIADEKAVLASTDMLKIYDSNFMNAYASKYLHKVKQKEVPAGCTSPGRFWGASRGLVDTKISFNQNFINDFRKDIVELLELKNFRGSWLILNNEKADLLKKYLIQNNFIRG